MWTLLVWAFSAICYCPLYFSHQGADVPAMALKLKYLFILMPLFFTFLFLFRSKGVRKWVKGMFEFHVQPEAFALCLIAAAVGVFLSSIAAKQEWKPQTMLAGAAYLFCMAWIEEVAWRGYRLKAAMQDRKDATAVFLVSAEWAIWHIPMWVIRNGIGMEEIVFWILYTVTVGCILGESFVRYRNILVPVLLHTVFNVCFLMPVRINLMAALSIWIAFILFQRVKDKQKKTSTE